MLAGRVNTLHIISSLCYRRFFVLRRYFGARNWGPHDAARDPLIP